MRSRKTRYCPTGKKPFRSAVLARIALNEAIASGRDEKYRYECPKCRMWHLTSHEYKSNSK